MTKRAGAGEASEFGTADAAQQTRGRHGEHWGLRVCAAAPGNDELRYAGAEAAEALAGWSTAGSRKPRREWSAATAVVVAAWCAYRLPATIAGRSPRPASSGGGDEETH